MARGFAAMTKSRGPRPKFDWAEAIRLLDTGMPIKEVAAKFGVSTTAIRRVKPKVSK